MYPSSFHSSPSLLCTFASLFPRSFLLRLSRSLSALRRIRVSRLRDRSRTRASCPRLFPRTRLLLISILHPLQSRMIFSSRPHFVIADSLARSDSSRRSRHPASKRGETWTRSSDRIMDRRLSFIRRLSETCLLDILVRRDISLASSKQSARFLSRLIEIGAARLYSLFELRHNLFQDTHLAIRSTSERERISTIGISRGG